MFKTTTLSLKSESFNDPPSIVCTVVSRSSGGKVTIAGGGAGFVGRGTFAARLAGALLVSGSLELQLDKPSAPTRPTATSVSTTRPGVQKDFLGKAIKIPLS